jgi:hypothetical protein
VCAQARSYGACKRTFRKLKDIKIEMLQVVALILGYLSTINYYNFVVFP